MTQPLDEDAIALAQIALTAARALVQEERHRSFGVDLVGQSYALDLHPDEANGAVLR